MHAHDLSSREPLCKMLNAEEFLQNRALVLDKLVEEIIFSNWQSVLRGKRVRKELSSCLVQLGGAVA